MGFMGRRTLEAVFILKAVSQWLVRKALAALEPMAYLLAWARDPGLAHTG